MGSLSPSPCKGFHPLTLLRCAHARSGGNKITLLKAAAKRRWGPGDEIPRAGFRAAALNKKPENISKKSLTRADECVILSFVN